MSRSCFVTVEHSRPTDEPSGPAWVRLAQLTRPRNRLRRQSERKLKCAARPRPVQSKLSSMKARVYVSLKPTVLDPQGQTIRSALNSLGYAGVADVRQGKFFDIELDGLGRAEAQRQLEQIAQDVLANPVIEEYRVEILE